MANSRSIQYDLVTDLNTRNALEQVNRKFSDLEKASATPNYAKSEATDNAVTTYNSVYPTFTQVIPLTVSITTNGSPVLLLIRPTFADGQNRGFLGFYGSAANTVNGFVQFRRNGTVIYESVLAQVLSNVTITVNPGTHTIQQLLPPSCFQTIDFVSKGTYSYTVWASLSTSGQIFAPVLVELVAFELK